MFKGRGLFVTKDIKPGTLAMGIKAIAFAGRKDQHAIETGYDLNEETLTKLMKVCMKFKEHLQQNDGAKEIGDSWSAFQNNNSFPNIGAERFQHDELEKKFLEERGALKARYQKLYNFLYSMWYEIVNGIIEPEGLVALNATKLAKAKKDKEEHYEKMKRLSWHFIITERDEEALKLLRDKRWCKIDYPKGFKLEFSLTPTHFLRTLC
ncbi:hypothetical protein L7F22_065262 [Adiantum nelumboides]|nr:hypothetical protein [Adiantum nelumboides]